MKKIPHLQQTAAATATATAGAAAVEDLEQPPPLLFDWGKKHDHRWRLLAFLSLSFLLHALCFYAIHITYPPAVALLPPPGQLTVMPAAMNPEFASWLEAEDPALLVRSHEKSDAELLREFQPVYTPSFLEHAPEPLPLPLLPLAETLEARLPQEIILPPFPMTAPTIAPAPLPTLLELKGDDINLELEVTQDLLAAAAPGLTSPEPAVFMVHLTPPVEQLPEVRYLFLQQSSGDPALDREALRYLQTVAGLPVGAEGQWTLATFHWGAASEAAGEQQQEEAQP